jgi:hypothetical protein
MDEVLHREFGGGPDPGRGVDEDREDRTIAQADGIRDVDRF